jgi:hypothetical protein
MTEQQVNLALDVKRIFENEATGDDNFSGLLAFSNSDDKEEDTIHVSCVSTSNHFLLADTLLSSAEENLILKKALILTSVQVLGIEIEDNDLLQLLELEDENEEFLNDYNEN